MNIHPIIHVLKFDTSNEMFSFLNYFELSGCELIVVVYDYFKKASHSDALSNYKQFNFLINSWKNYF